ncbi:endonuclease III [bacterium BMS3Bbin09]|nr:endonuclease III [bacterium BMS3Bbin09]
MPVVQMPDAKKITRLLLNKYQNPESALNFSNPLQLLMATILSARCTDVKVNEVTKGLFKKYHSAKDFANADQVSLEAEIRPTGFYRNKAKMLIECCRKLEEDFKGNVPDTMKELTTLSGVGRKTANVVLACAFGKQAIAVDTHVLRVSNRLGLSFSNNPDKVEQELVAQLPKGKLTRMHLALILHGRQTCVSRKPKCGDCVLNKECDWREKNA